MLSSSNGVDDAVKAIDNSLRTKPSSVKVWKAGPIDDSTHLRCHYAVQLGTQKASDEAGQERVVSIRESFNSPFRPFVLASTSIGQEGLDFHWYCSDVVHWNLPSNPIDLEQREGRVNRYQSLVVRRRVVQALSKETDSFQRWAALFETAAKMPWKTDLVPYWHYPEGDAQIRRLVPVMAMSQEQQRYPQMLKILSLYRLAFGQPGQSELLEHLKSLNLCTGDLEKLKRRLMIQLAPILYQDESQDVPA
nr:helicase-related protein [Pseudomonas lactis]